MTKTTKQRTAALRQRRAALGIERHEHIYHKDDPEKVVWFVSGLNQKRHNMAAK